MFLYNLTIAIPFNDLLHILMIPLVPFNDDPLIVKRWCIFPFKFAIACCFFSLVASA